MTKFRFAILGAGNIAAHFCNAVRLIDNCSICAVASRSPERAEQFALKHDIDAYYDSYETMLTLEKPDCAYVATTGNTHFSLSMLCLQCGVPVLCEKAMFLQAGEARECLGLAKEKRLFVMEAVWSLFLPTMRIVKDWIGQHRIGDIVMADFTIGFAAPDNAENRYFNPALAGGAANDITIYGCHIVPWLLGKSVIHHTTSTVTGDSGVDVASIVTLRLYGGILASIQSSILAPMEERLIIYGRKGKIIVPNPHFASEAFLYADGSPAEHYRDTQTRNGFTYEIEETIRCVRHSLLESSTVPHLATIACTDILDGIRNSTGNHSFEEEST